jgi:hypothetical protein
MQSVPPVMQAVPQQLGMSGGQKIDPATVLWAGEGAPEKLTLGYLMNCMLPQPTDQYSVSYQRIIVKRTTLKCPQLGTCGDSCCGHDEETDNIETTKINGLNMDKVPSRLIYLHPIYTRPESHCFLIV